MLGFNLSTLYPLNYCLQASSLGHGIKGALYLVNPLSLFKFSAVSRISQKGNYALLEMVVNVKCSL